MVDPIQWPLKEKNMTAAEKLGHVGGTPRIKEGQMTEEEREQEMKTDLRILDSLLAKFLLKEERRVGRVLTEKEYIEAVEQWKATSLEVKKFRTKYGMDLTTPWEREKGGI